MHLVSCIGRRELLKARDDGKFCSIVELQNCDVLGILIPPLRGRFHALGTLPQPTASTLLKPGAPGLSFSVCVSGSGFLGRALRTFRRCRFLPAFQPPLSE